MLFKKSMFKTPRNTLEGSDEKRVGRTLSVPSDLYYSCPSCKSMVSLNDLKEQLLVCPKCGYHEKMGARERILSVADEGTFVETGAGLASSDPLNFPGYVEKLKKAAGNSGEAESVITGTCRIGGRPCAIFALDPNFMMGSMGSVTGEKITVLFEMAAAQSLPVVGFSVSGGARIQEGILSLMQMAKTSGAVKHHSDSGNLYISVLTNPTTGGVMASFAMEGDIILSEPKALIGFAGPRVIEQTMRQKLPDGFQKAEFLLEKGFIDNIVERRQMKSVLTYLLCLHQRRTSYDRI
ncbi:MAG: Acetyl-coenzyme A carboxylase carboxyl transferase subunit beta [Firmicutes bacterium ADurb.Bin182]|nr:MAG: Acetyl-coenzyme A carboxylase carboxyl transferase subunit beta [Firmicutes bacterium ADurb.Bin182]